MPELRVLYKVLKIFFYSVPGKSYLVSNDIFLKTNKQNVVRQQGDQMSEKIAQNVTQPLFAKNNANP
jgi:hypothetical protein